jgi:hypothetical protein
VTEDGRGGNEYGRCDRPGGMSHDRSQNEK